MNDLFLNRSHLASWSHLTVLPINFMSHWKGEIHASKIQVCVIFHVTLTISTLTLHFIICFNSRKFACVGNIGYTNFAQSNDRTLSHSLWCKRILMLFIIQHNMDIYVMKYMQYMNMLGFIPWTWTHTGVYLQMKVHQGLLDDNTESNEVKQYLNRSKSYQQGINRSVSDKLLHSQV